MSARDHSPSQVTAVVADDDPITRRLLRAFLERMNISVIEAADGEQLLSECRKAKPTIVVTDIQMPEMDGLAACAEIRKSFSPTELPILTISGWYDEQSASRAAEMGIAHCLVKPFQQASFENHVNEALAQAASGSAEKDRERNSA